MLNTTTSFSQRNSNLQFSPISAILAVLDQPGMVSFAGGIPAAETFPTLRPGAIPAGCLQYGASEGDTGLRERIAADLRAIGLSCAREQVLILSGSQQGIDLVAKLFVDPGTPVAVESPTYLAALDVFRYFGARFTPFEPRQASDAWTRQGRPALAYVTPTFQNPTGRCYSTEQRAALAAACDDHHVVLFEDDPYRELVYDACDRSPVCGRLRRAPWIYQGSFSKSLAPGLRLGFLAASPDLIPHLARLKQAADIHSNRVAQWLVLQQLNDVARQERLASLVEVYRRKRDHFAAVLHEQMSSLASWQTPPGGLFFWLTLRRPVDTCTLLSQSIEQGVAFMPGEPFYPTPPQRCACLRLSFSHADEAQTQRGLELLGGLLRRTLERSVS